MRNAVDTDNANQASIDAATKELEAFIKTSAAAASLLVNSISDAHMYHIRLFIEDPVVTWQRLQKKYEHVSEMEANVVQQLLNDF